MERNDAFRRRQIITYSVNHSWSEILNLICLGGEAVSVHDQMQITGTSLMCTLPVSYSTEHLNSPYYLVHVLSESD